MAFSVNWERFTPVASLVGGGLIGLSCAAYLHLAGRIAGISGIVSSVVHGDRAHGLKLSFFSAMILTGAVLRPWLNNAVAFATNAPIVAQAVGGLLVGLGASKQNGCTSGHGVCGLSRLSPKSLVAVLAFMSSGIFTGTFVRPYFFGASQQMQPEATSNNIPALFAANLVAGGALVIATQHGSAAHVLTGLVCGSMFSAGLALSSMANPSKLIDFLNLLGPRGWDPSLAFVMLGAILAAFVPFQLVARQQRQENRKPPTPTLFPEQPIGKFVQPTSWFEHEHKLQTLVGAGMFGVGWAIAGQCPGPGLLLAGAGVPAASFVFVPSMVAGILLSSYV